MRAAEVILQDPGGGGLHRTISQLFPDTVAGSIPKTYFPLMPNPIKNKLNIGSTSTESNDHSKYV